MLRYDLIHHPLIFKIPGGTSRGILKTKDTWVLKIWDSEQPKIIGYGECSIIPGLSIDKVSIIPHTLDRLFSLGFDLDRIREELLNDLPALLFAIETALLDLKMGGRRILFESDFTGGKRSIPINGLIWMNSEDVMKASIDEKIQHGFSCIKLKVGAIDWDKEIGLLKYVRSKYPAEVLEIRVDANGAFEFNEAMDKLVELSNYHIHSIEQPIRPGQAAMMAELCSQSPVSIALDEELIGVTDNILRLELLSIIKPQFIILKPSLIGGLLEAEKWIALAERLGIGWWATSALESNIGLNAIAQWVSTMDTKMFQGLGTGGLFTNNFESPLRLTDERMNYLPQARWNLP